MNFRNRARVVLLVVGIGLLQGCASTARRPDADLLSGQTQREAALRAQANWSLSARVSVSDGENHGSGRLDWKQNGENFILQLRAPVTGKSWRLSGKPGAVQLEGAGRETQRGRDAETLLQQALGWRVPVSQLTAWVRGLRGERGRAEITFGSDGLAAGIAQSQWTVDFRAWFADRDPPLPRKIFAQRPPYKVRLVIERWSIND